MSAAPRSASPIRRALPFTALLFFLVGAHALLETARDGMFLTEQPVTRLPWLYLTVTAGVLVLTPLQRRLWGGRSHVALLLTLLGACGVTLAFWAFAATRSTVLGFYVWTALFSSLVFVQFWLTADEAFSVDEAKRVFGFIAAGGLLGAVCGSGTARVALGWTDPRSLLLISAGVTLGAAVVAQVTTRGSCEGHVAQPELMAPRELPGYVKRDPYLRLLAVLALLTAASATLIDYLFKAAVAAGTAPEHIPRLVANVYLGQSVLALVVELVLVGILLRNTGVTRSLGLLPLVVLAGASGYALGAGLVAVLLLKTLDGGLRPSVYRVGTELLFLPIGPAERRVVKPSIDTLGQRGGQALASLFLLAVPVLPARHQLAVTTVCLALVGLAWVQASWVLRRRYLQRFQRELGAGRVPTAAIGRLDLASAEVLVAALGSSSVREVLTALDVLTASGRLGLVPSLILYHPDPLVVRSALRHLSGAQRPDVDALLPFLLRHPDDQVRAIAVERWARAGHASDALHTALNDPSPRVQASALVALSATENGGEAREQLEAIAAGPDLDARRALAWALGNAPRPDLVPIIKTLFLSGDVETRRELLRATPSLPAPPPELVSQLVALLVEPRLRSGATDVLVVMGPLALAELERLLLSPDTPYALARELPPAIARFPAESAARVLLKRLVQPRGGLDRFRSLRALNQQRRTHPRLALDQASLQAALELELRSVFRSRVLRKAGLELGLGRGDGSQPAGTLLLDLLRDRERRGIERAFRALGLLFPGGGLEQVYLGIRSEDRRRRDAAQEVLLELVRAPWRDPVLALLEPDVVLPAFTSGVLGARPTPESFVAALLDQSSEVVRLLTPCLAREEGWVGVVTRLRAGPRCADQESAAVAERAIQQLEHGEPARV
ncbi:MAG TPA: HEAT repeat domain-containing protein [Myxococcaceae bacterium]|nr:HEAT repeat domain-containing protein [Myxococcaceae bacterium]